MASMQPNDGEYAVKIPLTFDVKGNIKTISQKKITLSVLIVIGALLITVLLTVLGGLTFLWIGLAVTLVLQWVLRKVYLRENYFLGKYTEMQKNEGIFNYSKIWDIYEIEDFYPYICRFADGRKCVFIAFPKDVIVGKGEDSEFRHYDAVMQAYASLGETGLECMHIDYMDAVGKDSRLQSLYDMLDDTANSDLKKLLYRVFDNIKGRMNDEIASYDVYCFITRQSDDTFISNLNLVVSHLMRANYLGYYLLDRVSVGELVQSVFNIEDFQVRHACEEVYARKGTHTNFIKVIWSEKDGVRKTYSKRRAEIMAEMATREAEAKVKVRKMKDKKAEDIDLDAD